jgi:hypothetical protein
LNEVIKSEQAIVFVTIHIKENKERNKKNAQQVIGVERVPQDTFSVEQRFEISKSSSCSLTFSSGTRHSILRSAHESKIDKSARKHSFTI